MRPHLWLQHLFTGEPWESHYAYFVNGSPAYVIQGAIYEKWLSVGGEAGPLGAPRSDELDAHEADARSLVTLLHLRDISQKTGAQFTIVSEIRLEPEYQPEKSRRSFPVPVAAV